MPVDWSSSLQTRAAQLGRSTGSVREPRYHPQAPRLRSPDAQLGAESPSRIAPSARDPGRSRPEAPGSRLTSRGCRHGRPPAPPRRSMGPRRRGEDHCLGQWS
ncbi:hypothetical protein NDU88_005539 [Pleurodeles waltl]|uniref:Uncharacterized protein n=1 Tax=Pleurodeles waltl TaxID=8319 RepID=A0AAV7TBB6_PLEWA|nr:hypothetical protein NDU88_005539 [Pleurodeles waltl]